jgi:hypothetical protein
MQVIIAEVLMVVIVILMSTIVYIWAIPAFSSQTFNDNTGAAYSEKFTTVRGQFASFAVSSPEPVRTSPPPPSGARTCTASLPITSSTTSDIYVPPGASCLITVSVGNVFVDYGASLNVTGGTINRDIDANFSQSVIIQNSNVGGFIGLYNVNYVSIMNSQINTSGIGRCMDFCGAAMYAGGRGFFSMTNSVTQGQIENEVGHQTFFVGNRIGGRLEVESADQGQIINNTMTMLDLDANGVLVVSNNTVNGNALYGSNAWCGTGNNIITGTTTGTCIGNVEVDVLNTGSVPVKFVSIYLTNATLRGGLSWQLASGRLVQCGSGQAFTCSQLPIIIPVGEMAQITMGWVPPPTAFPLPWAYVYFIMVSSHQNYVDGYLYFATGLGLPKQSRLENRVCPPCY